MIGAIAGDIIGSTYEIFHTNKKEFNLYRLFSRYTDDTVLTFATADCLLNNGNYMEYYRDYCVKNQVRGYGGKFYFWAILNKKEPYNSMGNGSAMRISPVGYVGKSLEEVNKLAEDSAIVTHNHPEGIKGAQAIASLIYLGKENHTKEEMREYVEKQYGYDLSLSYKELKRVYKGGYTCPLTVPQAIISFLDSTDYEDAIRNAIALGGDSDTIACMAGGVAEAYYKEIPEEIVKQTYKRLPDKFKEILEEFRGVYGLLN